MPELITQAEYARRRNVSHVAVGKAIRTGRITTVAGANGKILIDPEVADIQWKRNTDPDQAARANASKGNSGAPQQDGGDGGDGSAYWDAKTRREQAEASMAELKMQQLSGNLVDRRRVEAAAASAGRQLRDSIMSVPAKIAPELGAITDPWEIERRLQAALRQVLDDASRIAATDLDKALTA